MSEVLRITLTVGNDSWSIVVSEEDKYGTVRIYGMPVIKAEWISFNTGKVIPMIRDLEKHSLIKKELE